ncbi:peroxiredoxin [Candidatus Daviesbacteria bacterium]|nr:peroxiredoxin [Candidatus Daviesbacteria bacterium]
MVAVDQPFIDFELSFYDPQTKKVGKVSLSSILKKKEWFTLFFYPADFTFVCPTELADLAKRYQEFKNADCQIYAVSTDTVYTHKAWLEKEKLLENVKYPMLSDHSGKLSQELSILDDNGMAQRAYYIIDPKGVLRAMQVVSDNIGRSAQEILRQVKALKYVSEHPGLACPASWDIGEKTLKPDIAISGKVFEKL